MTTCYIEGINEAGKVDGESKNDGTIEYKSAKLKFWEKNVKIGELR